MKTAPLPNPRPQRGVTIIYMPSRNCGRIQRYKESRAKRKPPPPPPDIPRWTDRDGVRQYYTTQLPTVEDTGRVYRGCGVLSWYEWVVYGLFILGALIAAL